MPGGSASWALGLLPSSPPFPSLVTLGSCQVRSPSPARPSHPGDCPLVFVKGAPHFLCCFFPRHGHACGTPSFSVFDLHLPIWVERCLLAVAQGRLCVHPVLWPPLCPSGFSPSSHRTGLCPNRGRASVPSFPQPHLGPQLSHTSSPTCGALMRLLFQRHLPGAAGMSDNDVPRLGRGKGVGAEPPSEKSTSRSPQPQLTLCPSRLPALCSHESGGNAPVEGRQPRGGEQPGLRENHQRPASVRTEGRRVPSVLKPFKGSHLGESVRPFQDHDGDEAPNFPCGPPTPET